MRCFIKLLGMPFLVFYSCAQQEYRDLGIPENPITPSTHSASFAFSPEDVASLAAQNITDVGVYVYLKDSLVFDETFSISADTFKIQLPLGENLQTFVVANANQLLHADSLSKVIIMQDPTCQKEVFLSDIIAFSSDKSVSNLKVELKRLVGHVVFQPKDDLARLQSFTEFDALNLVFSNVGTGYKISTGECIQQDVTVSSGIAEGYRAAIYSLPTFNGDLRTSIDVVYLKGDTEVNRTNSPLDTGISFEASKRTTVYMPILEDAFLVNSWREVTRSAIYNNCPIIPFATIESDF